MGFLLDGLKSMNNRAEEYKKEYVNMSTDALKREMKNETNTTRRIAIASVLKDRGITVQAR